MNASSVARPSRAAAEDMVVAAEDTEDMVVAEEDMAAAVHSHLLPPALPQCLLAFGVRTRALHDCKRRRKRRHRSLSQHRRGAAWAVQPAYRG